MEKDTHTSATIDFSTVLAAAVHDMKSSLFLLIQSIDNVCKTLDPNNNQARSQVANAHYEATRLNTNLVQILSLYRAGLEQLPITVDACFIKDLIEDITGSHTLYTEQKGIQITVDIDDDLHWYLDSELMFILINDVIINAMRYGTSLIKISTATTSGYLTLRVEDDGPGYPAHMLNKNHDELADFQLGEGRTGLGLFFANLIATAHTQHERRGSIELSNGGELGGSVFQVKIP